MKNHFYSIVICIALILSMFIGCDKSDKSDVSTLESNPVSTESDSAASDSDNNSLDYENAIAEQAYKDFLNGKIRVTTAEFFSEDDKNLNLDGLVYGQYSYDELKAAINELESGELITKYAIVDFKQGGVKKLVLRFENNASSFVSWTCIINYNGEGLDINYYYEDGGRTFASLYESGYLLTGGAISAAANTQSLIKFDKNGFGEKLFTKVEYNGTSATNAVYDLGKNENELTNKYDDISGKSKLLVHEYIAQEKVKLSVSSWSDDSSVREKEESLIDDLVKLGAELISEDEMNELTSLDGYQSEEVQWLDFDNNSSSDSDNSVDGDAVHVDYASEELLKQSDNYDEFIAEDSENQVKLVFTADNSVKDFSVLALTYKDVDDDGKMSFSSEVLYSQKSLTSEKPLVVGTVFYGSIPNLGISYVDSNGNKQVYSVSMSGFDDSLILTEINID